MKQALEVRLKVTEGIVYDGIKKHAEDMLSVIKYRLKKRKGKSYNDRTGNLRGSLSYQILRNGECIDDESIKLRDKPFKNVKFEVVINAGMVGCKMIPLDNLNFLDASKELVHEFIKNKVKNTTIQYSLPRVGK